MKPIKSLAMLAVLCLLWLGTSNCSGSADYEIFGTVYGFVSDNTTNQPIGQAIITLSPTGSTRTTDDAGAYKFDDLDAGQYTITVQKQGYQPNRRNFIAVPGESVQININLTPIP